MQELMSRGDICRNYRLARKKSVQIGILADLNCCERREIEKILEEAGETLPVRKKRAAGQKKKQKKVEQEPPEHIKMLYCFLDVIEDDLRALEAEKRRKEAQYMAIVKIIKNGGKMDGEGNNFITDSRQK